MHFAKPNTQINIQRTLVIAIHYRENMCKITLLKRVAKHLLNECSTNHGWIVDGTVH